MNTFLPMLRVIIFFIYLNEAVNVLLLAKILGIQTTKSEKLGIIGFVGIISLYYMIIEGRTDIIAIVIMIVQKYNLKLNTIDNLITIKDILFRIFIGIFWCIAILSFAYREFLEHKKIIKDTIIANSIFVVFYIILRTNTDIISKVLLTLFEIILIFKNIRTEMRLSKH